MDKKRTLLATAYISIVVACVLGSFFFGKSTANVEMNHTILNLHQVKADEAIAKINLEEIKNEIATKKEKLKDEEKLFKETESDFKQMQKVITQNEKLTAENNSIQESINKKKEELSSLTKSVDSKKKELETQKETATTKKEGGKELPAGNFEVGKHISPGRYKISSNKSGTFSVNGGKDALVMFGTSDSAVSEYFTDLKEGDKIRQTVIAKYEIVD